MLNRWFLVAVVMAVSCVAPPRADAGDLRINLPKRSELTPVQRLNRDGVDAIRKQHYEKAEALFYKAYLFDPDDPFTLYDLGYISELQGQLDRAQKFYALAAEQASDARIDRANAPGLKGKRMREALSDLQDVSMQVNRQNVDAIRMLAEGRATEADMSLQQALALDPKNVFTLNNLGVAKEGEGELNEALKYYNQVAAMHSDEPVMVTLNQSYRGKPVSEVAAESAKKLRRRMDDLQNSQAQAAMLTLRGVSALNRNDWRDASHDFLQAYKLDPTSAFAINNVGYLAEMDGDLETASFFYEKARKAEGASDRVGLASRRTADGMKLFSVADESDEKVEGKMEAASAARRRQGGPIELKRRDGKPIGDDNPTDNNNNEAPQNPSPQPPGNQAPASTPTNPPQSQ